MPNKKKKAAKVHLAQTPTGYLVTGLLMWIVGYLLLILALESGNLIQWLGVLLAFTWGLFRIVEGLYKHIKQ